MVPVALKYINMNTKGAVIIYGWGAVKIGGGGINFSASKLRGGQNFSADI